MPGLYRGLLDLKASLDRWRGLEPDADAGQRDLLAELIQAQAAAVDLADGRAAWSDDASRDRPPRRARCSNWNTR